MGCDYYIQKELVIEYQAKNGKIYTIYTNRTIEKGYIFSYPNEDSDDDKDTSYTKYRDELEKKITENTYDKILFENGRWIEESYKKKYENYLNETCNNISKLLKVYKKITAWERT
jgi:hypothetical protein